MEQSGHCDVEEHYWRDSFFLNFEIKKNNHIKQKFLFFKVNKIKMFPINERKFSEEYNELYNQFLAVYWRTIWTVPSHGKSRFLI